MFLITGFVTPFFQERHISSLRHNPDTINERNCRATVRSGIVIRKSKIPPRLLHRTGTTQTLEGNSTRAESLAAFAGLESNLVTRFVLIPSKV